jgi:hypothetical protein
MHERETEQNNNLFEKYYSSIKSRVKYPVIEYLLPPQVNGLQLSYTAGITNALIHYGTIHPDEGKYILGVCGHDFADLFDVDIAEKQKIGTSAVGAVEEILTNDFGIKDAEIEILRHRDWRSLQHELERDHSIVIGNKTQAIVLNGLIDTRHEARVLLPINPLNGKMPRKKVSLPEIYKYAQEKKGTIISIN